jgi:hypothetical protein
MSTFHDNIAIKRQAINGVIARSKKVVQRVVARVGRVIDRIAIRAVARIGIDD